MEACATLGFIVDADDPRLRVVACPGAPACMHAHRPLRDDAARWAALLPKAGGVLLHVSGCAKGCARPAPTAATLTATANGYDLIVAGKAGDPPAWAGLSSERIEDLLVSEGRKVVRGPKAPGMKPAYHYEKDPAAIYRQSFAIIRREADLGRFSPIEERVAVRVIHACGMPQAADDLVFSPGAAAAARTALLAGAPIFCDARMVGEGVTRARLPAGNDVVCTLADASVPALAARLGTTRTAAAIDLWLPRLAGSVVVIGNAPTALFRLLESIASGAPAPAAIVGMPVGFVGAAESKEALIESGLPAIVVRGRKGGSAMAAAAVNALASDLE